MGEGNTTCKPSEIAEAARVDDEDRKREISQTRVTFDCISDGPEPEPSLSYGNLNVDARSSALHRALRLSTSQLEAATACGTTCRLDLRSVARGRRRALRLSTSQLAAATASGTGDNSVDRQVRTGRQGQAMTGTHVDRYVDRQAHVLFAAW